MKNQHHIIRVGDGKNFKASIRFETWGITTKSSGTKCFIKNAKEGDILWFLGNYKIGKKFLGMATLTFQRKRELGPLIAVTMTNEELGWSEGDWDWEIHYKDLYLIEDIELIGTFNFQFTILRSTSLTTDIDFDKEYDNIIRYSKVKKV